MAVCIFVDGTRLRRLLEDNLLRLFSAAWFHSIDARGYILQAAAAESGNTLSLQAPNPVTGKC